MTVTFFRFNLFILIIGFLQAAYAQNPEWEKINSPVNTTLTNLHFVNDSTGWASGEAGTIIRTTNSGTSWQIQNSTVPFFITELFFLNEQLGWALTLRDVPPFNTLILKTTNGGDEWIAEDFQDSSAFMRTIFFFDSLHGLIGGSYIAATSDGGNTWEKAEIDSNLISGYPVHKFKFYNEQFGYACGGALDAAGVIWRTTDSGKNWTAEGVSADQVFDLFIFDSLNALALSGDPEGFFGIAKINTTNGGLDWNYKELSLFGLSFALDFRTASEGWSASGYKFLFSSDTGESWEERVVPDSSIIYDLQFADSLNGYAAGADGAILKFIPPPVSVNEVRNKLNKFTLFQNYPNPFNPKTVISYQLSVTSNVTLKVYDVLGNEIATLVNKELPAGEYEVEFSRNLINQVLTSGIYFYQLKVYPANGGAGSFFETKKMLFLK